MGRVTPNGKCTRKVSILKKCENLHFVAIPNSGNARRLERSAEMAGSFSGLGAHFGNQEFPIKGYHVFEQSIPVGYLSVLLGNGDIDRES
jgi:hypothetical protein